MDSVEDVRVIAANFRVFETVAVVDPVSMTVTGLIAVSAALGAMFCPRG